MNKIYLITLSFLLLLSCDNGNRETVESIPKPISNKSVDSIVTIIDTNMDSTNKVNETEESLKVLAAMFEDDSPQKETVDSSSMKNDSIVQTDETPVRPANTTGPYLLLCSKDTLDRHSRDTLDSVSVSVIEGFDTVLKESDDLFLGFLIDFDNDSKEDLVVMERGNNEDPWYQILSTLYFYRNCDTLYSFHKKFDIYKMVPNIELFKYLEVIDYDQDEYPDFYVRNTEGGSGGGHSCLFLEWDGDSVSSSPYLKTGKWIELTDIDNDGTKDILFIDYNDYLKDAVFRGEKYSGKVLKLVEGEFMDISDDFLEYEDDIKASLR